MAVDDNVQHGIDDDPNNDAAKGAKLGGVGGIVTGAVAGAAAGPVGAVIGAVIGGVAGAVASGAAVGVVDQLDNDNTVSGIGGGATTDTGNVVSSAAHSAAGTVGSAAGAVGNVAHSAAGSVSNTVDAVTPGNRVPGVQTGGVANDGTPDTRGVAEKISDAVTGDVRDDKTGKSVNHP